jgi:Icc-related predicted phosphoesterase
VTACVFVSDLHGSAARAAALFDVVTRERPRAVFLGGDLLAHGRGDSYLQDVLLAGFTRARSELGSAYPDVFAILGNDDPRAVAEPAMLEGTARGVWQYVQGRRVPLGRFTVLGYNCIPPSPFRLKDWERYDVSRFVDPGCVPPDDGVRTGAPDGAELRRTIAEELALLGGDADLADAICLFHVPPYDTALDRAALDGRSVDHAPLDVHIGSIAVRRFIEARRPWLGLHGHVHESARLTGAWMDRLDRTILLGAAHDGPELAVIRFELERPEGATRELVGAAR